jgi:hypothetical protein
MLVTISTQCSCIYNLNGITKYFSFFIFFFETNLTCFLGSREEFKKKKKNITMMMPMEI